MMNAFVPYNARSRSWEADCFLIAPNVRIADGPDRISTPGCTFFRMGGDVDLTSRNRGLTSRDEPR
ncbi:hypothetical protein SBA2_750021 [Acidobacteriia bacterium SbA2]|nr:hypothetical protein SBA2_750021 [Acidobacteriia bacterium SbA2]